MADPQTLLRALEHTNKLELQDISGQLDNPVQNCCTILNVA